jgi:hypothetical protein
MAFADAKHNGALVSLNEHTGLWALHESTGQYRAWKAWLTKEFGITGFSRWITANYEWPPTSQLGADKYAEYLSALRDENKNPIPVPRHPDAWNGIIPPAPEHKLEHYVDMATVERVYRKLGWRVYEETQEAAE